MKRSQIYKPLKDQALIGMPYLIFRDLQKGQMVRAKDNYPIPLPALLIDIGDVRFSNLSEHQQKGDCVISIYLYMDLVTDSFDDAEMENETIELLDHMDDIFQTFEGFSIPGLTPLVRQIEYKPQYGTRFIMYRVDFASTLDSGKQIKQTTTAKPEVELKPYNFKRR